MALDKYMCSIWQKLVLGSNLQESKMKFPRVEKKRSRVKITWSLWKDYKGGKTIFSVYVLYAQK